MTRDFFYGLPCQTCDTSNRFSITTIFQMILLLRSPEGMQHTMRLHLTVVTCPSIMSFIRLMQLIPSCKLIIIHPLFGLSTCIAVVDIANIYMMTSITIAALSGFPVSRVATSFCLAKPHLCQVPSHDTGALSQSGVSDQHNSLVDSVLVCLV